MEQRRIIHVEERLPILPTIPLSLQHLFAMFGSTVLVPFLLHVDPATALFMNGVGTLIYLTICKWRLPAYLGSSFAFISPVLAVCATPGMSYGDAQGGFIVFGLSFMILAAIVDKVGTKWIDVLFPPAAMGSIVAIIGLELAPLAMNMSGYMGEVQGMSNETAMIISTFTLVVTILATVLGRGFIGIIPILIGVIAGYILSFFMGVVDWTHVQEMPWFAFPTFYKPEFNLSAIMMIMPALFVVLAEHLGHLFVTSDIVGRDLIKDPGLHRSLFADGLASWPLPAYTVRGSSAALLSLPSSFPSSARSQPSSTPSRRRSWAVSAFSCSASSPLRACVCSSKRKSIIRARRTSSSRLSP